MIRSFLLTATLSVGLLAGGSAVACDGLPGAFGVERAARFQAFAAYPQALVVERRAFSPARAGVVIRRTPVRDFVFGRRLSGANVVHLGVGY